MDSMVIVDAANVVGSVPDGWWRDRHGAAERLRDALPQYADEGLPGLVAPPVEVVLVVEGAARGVESVEGVRVVPASGSGDDRIVQLVAEEGGDRLCGGHRGPRAAGAGPGAGSPGDGTAGGVGPGAGRGVGRVRTDEDKPRTPRAPRHTGLPGRKTPRAYGRACQSLPACRLRRPRRLWERPYRK